jgi:xanthine dehydrogenase accessory factor
MSDQSEDVIDCMARMKGDGQPFALATVVRTEDATSAKAGAKAVIRADGSVVGWIGGGCSQGAAKKAASQALLDGRPRLVHIYPKDRLPDTAEAEGVELHKSSCPSGGTIELFVEAILPRPCLIVAGASPTARALAGLGRHSGFAVTVAALAEDQPGFKDADARIAGFDLSGAIRVGTSFVVVATQGKRDREALAAALSCGAPYVAFVGSRRKAAILKAAMIDQGLPTERVESLHAPAGLDIGAATPEEIALSILAEIVQERRNVARFVPASPTQIEEIEGGRFETRIVWPAPDTCRGNEGKQ